VENETHQARQSTLRYFIGLKKEGYFIIG